MAPRPGCAGGAWARAVHRRPGLRLPWRPDSGVTLIEALVALAVMSFGMLALVGVQATMRHNSDVARQRTEAARLASDVAESARLFTTLAPVNAQMYPSWSELVDTQFNPQALPGATANTSFNLQLGVTQVDDLAANDAGFSGTSMKLLQVAGTWTDRTGQNQQVVFDGLVSAVPANLAALTLVPHLATPPSQRGGRPIGIPVTAKDLGDGFSAIKPFDLPNVDVWVVDHRTGLVKQVCTGVATQQSAITRADLSACSAITGRLISGVVQFDGRTAGPLTAAVSEQPTGPALPLDAVTPLRFFAATTQDQPINTDRLTGLVCQAERLANAASVPPTRTHVAYICLVRLTDPSKGWGGEIHVVPGDYADTSWGGWNLFIPASGNNQAVAATHRICRYTTASTDFTANENHPRFYGRPQPPTNPNANPLVYPVITPVTQNLINQNFLVVRANLNCPTDGPINPGLGDLVNSNTLPHQQ